MRRIILLSLLSVCSFSLASEDHADEKEAVELTQEAKKNFGITTTTVKPVNGRAQIPLSALINSQDKKQIFVFHNDKYESREVNVLKKDRERVTIDGLTESIELVVTGVNHLKIVELSHNEEGGGGHGH